MIAESFFIVAHGSSAHVVLHIFIIVFSIAGFSLAHYIRTKKLSSKPLVCPVGADCDSVVRSEYASFLGVPVELIGMGYYSITLVGHVFLMLFPAAMTVESMFVFLTITTVAFLFSLYLTAIQGFVLRGWCTWCLGSAGISGLIFLASLTVSRFGLLELLAENAYLIKLVQSLALAVGVGAATIVSLFYIKFLADLRVSASESDTLRSVVQVIWIALAVVLLTGIGLYLPTKSNLAVYAPAVLAALIVTACLSVISFVFYYHVAPQTALISSGAEHEHASGEMRRLRRAIFALSALSLVSWYFVFALRVVAPTLLEASTLLFVYAAALGAATFFSFLYEWTQPR